MSWADCILLIPQNAFVNVIPSSNNVAGSATAFVETSIVPRSCVVSLLVMGETSEQGACYYVLGRLISNSLVNGCLRSPNSR